MILLVHIITGALSVTIGVVALFVFRNKRRVIYLMRVFYMHALLSGGIMVVQSYGAPSFQALCSKFGLYVGFILATEMVLHYKYLIKQKITS